MVSKGIGRALAAGAVRGTGQEASAKGFTNGLTGAAVIPLKLSGGRRWVKHGPIYGLTCSQIITKRINASLSLWVD